MKKRTNYYNDLSVDYSQPGLVSNQLTIKLLGDAESYISQCEKNLPQITPEYSLAQIEQENKDW